jgi:hypothetical protein
MKVVCEAPISEIIGNKDVSGRIAKWAIQLSTCVPTYARRDAIKSQALVDFLVDWGDLGNTHKYGPRFQGKENASGFTNLSDK